jgi:hypothetical protein
MASTMNNIALIEGLEEAKRALEKDVEDAIETYVKVNKRT